MTWKKYLHKFDISVCNGKYVFILNDRIFFLINNFSSACHEH